jgi:Tol biopolymer transport system component
MDSTIIWEFDVGTKKLTQLTNGTGENDPSVTASGDLSFTATKMASNIWALPIDANSGKVRGSAYAVTEGTADYWFPTVSPDGLTLVTISNKFGTSDVWVKDLNG